MPTYNYKCTKCDDRFEIIQRITADKLEFCTKCKDNTLVKIMVPSSTGGFQLSGPGWYKTGGY